MLFDLFKTFSLDRDKSQIWSFIEKYILLLTYVTCSELPAKRNTMPFPVPLKLMFLSSIEGTQQIILLKCRREFIPSWFPYCNIQILICIHTYIYACDSLNVCVSFSKSLFPHIQALSLFLHVPLSPHSTSLSFSPSLTESPLTNSAVMSILCRCVRQYVEKCSKTWNKKINILHFNRIFKTFCFISWQINV